MAVSFYVEVVTPDQLVFSQEALFATVPGQEGMFGVLPGHAPLISAVQPGVMQVGEGNDAQLFVVSGGYAEVLPTRLTVLVDDAVPKESIDVVAMQKLHDKASDRLQDMVMEDPEYLHTKYRVQFSQACLDLRAGKKNS